MNIKKIRIFFSIVLVASIMINCSREEGADNISNYQVDESTNYSENDNIATTSVKKYVIGQTSDKSCIFYNGYNNQYVLYVMNGYIRLLHRLRYNGTLVIELNSGIDPLQCGFKDIGKVSKITDITSKDVIGGENAVKNDNMLGYNVEFQPKHGYSIIFTTDDGEQKYLRIFAESYTGNYELETIAIQYQLY